MEGPRDAGERTLTGELLSPSRVGDLNRARVIHALVDYGPLSRAELARMADVTRATIGGIVQSLLEAGLVDEQEPAHEQGRVGKPARPVYFAPGAGLSGAIAIGRRRLEAAVVDARGEILGHGDRIVDTSDGHGVARHAIEVLNQLLVDHDGILGLGVSVPNPVDAQEGTIFASRHAPGLGGEEFRTSLVNAFGEHVYIDTMPRAQAVGERWFGLGRGRSRFATLQTGHALGAGLVVNGILFRGPSGVTGEIGHTVVDRTGEQCDCGSRGCWETVATLAWLRREAAERGLNDPGRLTAARLAEMATGDETARSLLDDYGSNLALGIINLVNLVNPGLWILHGDAAGGGEMLRSTIDAEVRTRVLEHNRESLEIVVSDLRTRAALLGAAGLVLSESLHLIGSV